MTKTSVWAWTLTSILSLSAFSCAKATDGGDGDGDGDGDSSTTGGTTSTGGSTGSGGFVISMSGGAPGSGGGTAAGGAGTGGMVDACEDGDTDDCANQFADYPVGTTTCASGAWDISTCLLCTPDAPVLCSVVMPTKPEGEVTCNSTGLGYVEDPVDVCATCVVGEDTADCNDAGNTTVNRGGTAECALGGYDWTQCTECDDEMTPPTCAVLTAGAMQGGDVVCASGSWDDSGCTPCEPDAEVDCANIVDGAQAYTAGTTTCNGSGTAWIEPGNCEWCGDGEINGTGEVCDGTASVPTDLTCDTLDPPYEGDSDPVDDCTASCQYDTSNCSACAPGISKCLGEGSPTTCSGPSACSDAQCGAGFSCTMTCTGGGDICDGMSCAAGADCTVVSGHQGQVDIECLSGSSCAVDCGGNNPASCGIVCHDGATCSNDAEHQSTVDFECLSGSNCAIECGSNGPACDIDCDAGSTCSVNGSAHDAKPAGTANCASGTCTYGLFGSALDINCEGGGTTCDIDIVGQQTWSGDMTCAAGTTCVVSATSQGKATGVKTCQAGATCNFEVTEWDTDQSGIVCENNSTCNFTFNSPGTNSSFTYTCAADATCNCTGQTGVSNPNLCNCTGPGC